MEVNDDFKTTLLRTGEGHESYFPFIQIKMGFPQYIGENCFSPPNEYIL